MAVNEPISFKSLVDTVASTTHARQIFRYFHFFSDFMCSVFSDIRLSVCFLSRIDEPVLRAHVATVVQDFSKKPKAPKDTPVAVNVQATAVNVKPAAPQL
jgi:hypothetical protein